MDDLKFEELNKSEVSDEVIQEFDCGNKDITEYLHEQAKQDSIDGNGVTYILVRGDKKRIYAYATIKAHSLYRYESSEKISYSRRNQWTGFSKFSCCRN